jgi:5-oxoprolinase (ATP-hydrolysing)
LKSSIVNTITVSSMGEPTYFEQTDNCWQIWVDTGGTFTDCIGYSPDGKYHRAKVLSNGTLRARVVELQKDGTITCQCEAQFPENFLRRWQFHADGDTSFSSEIVRSEANGSSIVLKNPAPLGALAEGRIVEFQSPEEAPIVAARLITQTPLDQPLPPIQFRLATTKGTNALLERKGARIALFVTQGFRDLLFIGNQQRPNLFALNIIKAEPLYEQVIEVEGRLDKDGNEVVPLELAKLAPTIKQLQDEGIATAVVSLMHSYKNLEHEQLLQQYLLSQNMKPVILSSQVNPTINYLRRTQTALAEGYLHNIIREYLGRVATPLKLSNGSTLGSTLHVMTSAGGLVTADAFQAKDSLLSGPAGGIVGARHTARKSGIEKILTFDMGGTSTDVARCEGTFDYTFELTINNTTLATPALAIETVAAGGGSICWFDGDRLQVGPHSAGASPGPACYGAGGPLTITDINLLSGRLASDLFRVPLDEGASQIRLDELLRQLENAGVAMEVDRLLSGLLAIANENMAEAIRRVSVRQGYHPADYTLVAFGGAGGQHACDVAELLDIRRVLLPAEAGLLSARGVGTARLERFTERQILATEDKWDKNLQTTIHEMETEALEQLIADGLNREDVEVRQRIARVRLLGQEQTLDLDFENIAELPKLFREKFESVFGYFPDNQTLELESLRIIGSQISHEETVTVNTDNSKTDIVATSAVLSKSSSSALVNNQRSEISCYYATDVSARQTLNGPCLILEEHGTTWVGAGWTGTLDAAGNLVLLKS